MPYPKQKRHKGPLIYLLTFPNNQQYVGQTNGFFEVRMNKHKSSAKNRETSGCRKLNNAIRKYGWDNITKEILLYCDSDQLDMFESKMIDAYNTLDPNGYNLMQGGNSNKKMSNGMKTKASASHIRNHRNKKPDSVNYGCIYEHSSRTNDSNKTVKKFAIIDHPLCEFKDHDTFDNALESLFDLNYDAHKQKIDIDEYDVLESSAKYNTINTYAEVRETLYDMIDIIANKHREEDRWKRINNANKFNNTISNNDT